MNTCSTCKSWGATDLYYDEDADVEKPYIHRRCISPKLVNVSKERHEESDRRPPDIAMYSDCEGYDATFRTGPDFGCIHHEAKTQ